MFWLGEPGCRAAGPGEEHHRGGPKKRRWVGFPLSHNRRVHRRRVLEDNFYWKEARPFGVGFEGTRKGQGGFPLNDLLGLSQEFESTLPENASLDSVVGYCS